MKMLTVLMIAALIAVLIAAGAALAGPSSFTDLEAVDAEHLTAVEYVTGRGIIVGFPDGSFRPDDTLTRAQAAKMICVTLEGAEKADALPAGNSGFSDVPDDNWASKYVAYCAERHIVSGVGGGKFDPNGELSVCAFGKMLLVAFGHDPVNEGLIGGNWVSNTQHAIKAGGYHKKLAAIADIPIDRESACQLTCNFVFPEAETQN